MAKLRKLRRSFEKKVLVGFLSAACVVVVLAAVTLELAAEAREAAQLVAHTHQVVQTITETRADTLQIEFSTQSFRISGEAGALDERDKHLAEREVAMARLKALVAGTTAQEQRWQQLRAVLDERIAISRQVEELTKRQGPQVAAAFVTTAPLRATRERTYAVLGAMDREARAVLEQRTAHELRAQRILAFSAAAVAALLLALAPGMLEFEITESTVMEDPEFALRVLHALRALGVPLYIDDFGTGYSSLSYLLKLPMDYVKIDQSFVRDMSRNIDSAIIVKSTVDLAHALGRKVVAEGVETQQDWNMLAEIGCDIAQGYFIARPMPASDFAAWVQGFTGLRGFTP